MFNQEVYLNRRNQIKEFINEGIILIFGNSESPMNYKSNTYWFRQDSNFLYFFGIDYPDFVGIIDIDSETEFIFGNEVDMEDIIWMGHRPTLSKKAESAGVKNTGTLDEFTQYIKKAIIQKRRIHFLPPYSSNRRMKIAQMLEIPYLQSNKFASVELIKAI